LEGWNEENEARHEVSEEHFPQSDTRDPGDGEPENGDCQDPDGGDRDHGNEGIESGPIEVAAPFRALTSSFVLFPTRWHGPSVFLGVGDRLFAI
jgi:hypothetical protein